MVTYPLNNIEYNAEDAELYNCPRKSGVWTAEDFPYSVTGADTNIQIGAGAAWIRNARFKGKVAAELRGVQLNLGLSDPVFPRIDAVVLQFSSNANKSEIIVKKGSAQTRPEPPAVVQTESLYELHLYHVYRAAGSTTVTSSDITDKRLDPAYCGLMGDSVTEIDTKAINKQFLSLLENLRKEISGVKDGSAYMLASDYTNDGRKSVTLAENANKLGGELPAHYASKDYVVPKTGGKFTGDVYASSITATKRDGKNGAFIAPGQVVVYVGESDDGNLLFNRVMIDGEDGRIVFRENKTGTPAVTETYAKSFTAGTPQDWNAYVDNNFGFGILTGQRRVIGTSWEGEKLRFVSKDNVEFRTDNSSGDPFIGIDALSFNQKSSKKYKHDISPITDECAKKLLDIRPVSFVYNNDPYSKKTYGMIAEEVEEVDNTACSYLNGVVDSIDYSKFVPQLIKLCQVQQEQIDKLTKKVFGESHE